LTSQNGNSNNKRRILAADDEPDITFTLKEGLVASVLFHVDTFNNRDSTTWQLISSQVGSNLPDPDSPNAAVNIHKDGKKDVTIANNSYH
jgi:hypothetical protein